MKNNNKASLFIYIVINCLTVLSMIIQLIEGKIENALLCILTLILLTLPVIVQKKFKIVLPVGLEITLYLFIFSAIVLGSVYNFYSIIKEWDKILHVFTGIITAFFGLGLVNILNRKNKKTEFSPLFVCFFAFCFTLAVGVIWEFYEYSMDSFFGQDAQRDTIVNHITSVDLNDGNTISGIAKTVLYDEDGNVLYVIDSGYLDIGLHDTMQDLLVSSVGSLVICIIAYFHLENKNKFIILKSFIPKEKGIRV